MHSDYTIRTIYWDSSCVHSILNRKIKASLHLYNFNNLFHPPPFVIGDRVTKHLVEDGLGKGIQVAELCVFLVDDASEKVQFKDDALLLVNRWNRDWD